jgi:hypothetical protein
VGFAFLMEIFFFYLIFLVRKTTGTDVGEAAEISLVRLIFIIKWREKKRGLKNREREKVKSSKVASSKNVLDN